MRIIRSILLFTFLAGIFFSCETIDLYEKHVNIPKREWSRTNTPSFSFDILDTLNTYDLYVVLRHADAYNYNNIWMDLEWKSPNDSVRKQQVEITLANGERWLGTGMDDIFEVRRKITARPVRFTQMGKHTFTLRHSMRQDPLSHILNVGFRVEKTKP
jgi:gliding motility-associated lipoprotein GldH